MPYFWRDHFVPLKKNHIKIWFSLGGSLFFNQKTWFSLGKTEKLVFLTKKPGFLWANPPLRLEERKPRRSVMGGDFVRSRTEERLRAELKT